MRLQIKVNYLIINIFIISLTILVFLCTLILFNNQILSHYYLTNDNLEILNNPLREWKYRTSDVSIGENAYPFMVLRDKFKGIKKSNDGLLVGYIFEIVNTSAENGQIKIDYKLVDSDNFVIVADSVTQLLPSLSAGAIQSTIMVAWDDVPRISHSTWGITNINSIRNDNTEKDRHELAGNIIAKQYDFDDWVHNMPIVMYVGINLSNGQLQIPSIYKNFIKGLGYESNTEMNNIINKMKSVMTPKSTFQEVINSDEYFQLNLEERKILARFFFGKQNLDDLQVMSRKWTEEEMSPFFILDEEMILKELGPLLSENEE